MSYIGVTTICYVLKLTVVPGKNTPMSKWPFI